MQTFENASTRLEEILNELSDSDISLEKSLDLYSQAAHLIKFCAKTLNSAQIKIQEIDELLISEVPNDKL